MVIDSRGGVLEVILGLENVLEDTFWSNWSWPRRSSPQKLHCSRLEDSAFFWTVAILLENVRNLAENLREPFLCFSSGEHQKNFFEDLFFWRTLAPVSLVLGLGLEHSCSSPRKDLSSEGLSLTLASDFFLCPWPWPPALCPWLHLWLIES